MSSEEGELDQKEEAEYEALYQGMLTELRGVEEAGLEIRRAIAEKTYIRRSVKHMEKIKELIGKCQSALSAIDELVNKCGPVGHREEVKCLGDLRRRILQKQGDTERLKNNYTTKLEKWDREARDLLLQDQQHREMLPDASPGKVGKMRKSLRTLAGRVDEKLFAAYGGGRKSKRRKYSKKRKSKRRKYSKKRKSSKKRK